MKRSGSDGISLVVGAFALLLVIAAGPPAAAQKELQHRADYFDDDTTTGSPPNVPTPGVFAINGNSDLVVTADGRFLYAAGKTDDAIAVFARDLVSGALEFRSCSADPAGDALMPDPGEEVEPCFEGTTMLRPLALALAPGDEHLYVASDKSDGVTAFARNSETGILTAIGIAPPAPNLTALETVKAVVVSPDGNDVYAAGFFSNTIALFERDDTTGELTLSAALFINDIPVEPGPTIGDLGMFVNDLAISTDGTSLYASLSRSSAPNFSGLLSITRNPTTGVIAATELKVNTRLGPGENETGIGGIRQVTTSPDDKHVYATGHADDAVAIFARNAADGRLEFLGKVAGGQDMNGAHALGVSPDGLRVYVLSKGTPGDVLPHALNVFARNPETGLLTLLEAHRNNSDGSRGLIQPNAVVTSPDGLDVYVAGERGDSIVHLPEPPAGSAQLLVLGALLGLHGVRRKSVTQASSQAG